jgi:hypothetical protein
MYLIDIIGKVEFILTMIMLFSFTTSSALLIVILNPYDYDFPSPIIRRLTIISLGVLITATIPFILLPSQECLKSLIPQPKICDTTKTVYVLPKGIMK